MYQYKKWEDLDISNDFLFAKVMRDESICKQLLEHLLSIKITKLSFIEEQKTINITKDGKSVRLDVYVQDSDRIFNIEMQTTKNKNLAKRARYYQSMIDLNTIEKGEPDQALKESYVIFICTFDPFGKGLSRYTFANRSDENSELLLEDGTKKIFLNTTAYAKETDINSKSFLQYVNGEKVINSFVDQIVSKVELVKSNREWGVEYMTLHAREQEMFYEGREAGREEGIEMALMEMIKKMYKNGIELHQIAKISELSEENVKKYLSID